MQRGDGPARRGRRGSTARESTDRDELAAALAALNSFQQMTQQADAKAGILVGAYVGLLAVVTAQLDRADPSSAGLGLTIAVWTVAVTLVIALSLTGCSLIGAVRPRTATFDEPNRFSVAQAAIHGRDQRECDAAAEGWRAAQEVARIALEKNRNVIRSIMGVAISGGLTIAWLTLLELI